MPYPPPGGLTPPNPHFLLLLLLLLLSVIPDPTPSAVITRYVSHPPTPPSLPPSLASVLTTVVDAADAHPSFLPYARLDPVCVRAPVRADVTGDVGPAHMSGVRALDVYVNVGLGVDVNVGLGVGVDRASHGATPD